MFTPVTRSVRNGRSPRVLAAALAVAVPGLLISACSSQSGSSAADRAVTTRLKQSLALVDIRLLDHFVIGDGAPVSLAARGWVGADGALTSAGREAHASVEDATDRAASRPWARLGPEATAEVAAVLARLSSEKKISS